MIDKFLYLPLLTLTTLLGVSFENTVQVGQIFLGLLFTVGAIAGIIYGIKWRTAYEVEAKVSDGLRDLFEMKDSESKSLHEKLLEVKDLVTTQAEVIARLEQLPNLERILQYMGEMAIKQDAQAELRLQMGMQTIDANWSKHELAAEERAQRIIDAIHEGRTE